MNQRHSEAFLAVVLGWVLGFVFLGPGGLLAGTLLGGAIGYWRIRTGP